MLDRRRGQCGGKMTLTLVLGGARSGKSAYAEQAAATAVAARGGRMVMIATAEARDEEMKARIAAHRSQRGDGWHTVEAPLDLAKAITELREDDRAVADCLTLWVSNLLAADMPVDKQADALITALLHRRQQTWLISNEVGFGIVPDNALARRFRDECGRLHQRLAAAADSVIMMVAGLPLTLK